MNAGSFNLAGGRPPFPTYLPQVVVTKGVGAITMGTDLTSPAAATRALATGALAIGALAIGAIAVGAFAIGRLSIRKARFGTLEIDRLIIREIALPPPPD